MRYYLLLTRLFVVGFLVVIGILLALPFKRWDVPMRIYNASMKLLSEWGSELLNLESERKIKQWGKE